MTDDVIDLLEKNERLQALNAELLAALKVIQASFDGKAGAFDWVNSDDTQAAFDNARALIARAEKQQ